MSSYLPVKIKPYLVHVLWKLFEGEEITYQGAKTKVIKIDLSSSIGRWIRSNCEKANRPPRADKYNLVFNLPNCSSPNYKGSVYQYVNGRNHFLRLPDEFVEDFNHFLEDIYRIRVCAFIEGAESSITVKDAIRSFIVKYELEEHGQTLESIERLYYREKENTEIFARFQHKWTHNK